MHRVNLELGKEETFSFYVLLRTDNGGKLIDLNHKLDIQTMTTDKKGSYSFYISYHKYQYTKGQ